MRESEKDAIRKAQERSDVINSCIAAEIRERKRHSELIYQQSKPNYQFNYLFRAGIIHPITAESRVISKLDVDDKPQAYLNLYNATINRAMDFFSTFVFKLEEKVTASKDFERANPTIKINFGVPRAKLSEYTPTSEEIFTPCKTFLYPNLKKLAEKAGIVFDEERFFAKLDALAEQKRAELDQQNLSKHDKSAQLELISNYLDSIKSAHIKEEKKVSL